MTVASTTNRVSYDGDGTTIAFAFTFVAFLESDIKVIVRSALGVETALTLDTDYEVALNDDGTGTVTLIGAYAADPPAEGEMLTIYRQVPYTQEIDLIENDPQRAEVLEEGFDRAVVLAQQLYDSVQRSILLPVSTEYSGLTLPEPAAGKYLGWNDDGDALENRDLIDSVGVSAFMATVLDDEDADAALTTLGVSAFAKTLLDDASAKAALATLNGMPAGTYELTDGATIAIDWDNGATQYVVLGATGRTVTFANPVEGEVYRFIIIQDGTGSRTITTWPSIKWMGGVAPTLSTAANAEDIVTLLYVDGAYRGDCSNDFAAPA